MKSYRGAKGWCVNGSMRSRRKYLRLRQSDVAKEVGVSQVTVSLWEQQRAAPRRANVGPLARALGVTEVTVRRWFTRMPASEMRENFETRTVLAPKEFWAALDKAAGRAGEDAGSLMVQTAWGLIESAS